MLRLSLVLLLCAPLFGQSQLASLSGTVTDPSAAVVPGVRIRLANTATGEAWTAVTNQSGNYFIPLVKPGEYALTADAAGFKELHRSGLVLETGAVARVDLALEIGSSTERVSVTASAPLLESETAAVAGVVENRTIINMPLIDRRAAQLARLNGFLVQIGSGSNFAIAGGRGNNSNWLIDGGNAQNVTLGVQTLSFDPPVESLQEFNVSISNYAAELGRTGGGVIQMTTKSGTNTFHGSAYEYLRNDAFDARTFFSADKPKLRYNLFGVSLGGPIRKDKTHFFFNYEGRQRTSESTSILNLPTPAETRGDFAASSVTIRDPAASDRTPFPGNVIPASRIDPVGARIAALYPAPNVPGRPSGSSNFRANPATTNPANVYVGRIDHIFSERDRVYGRMLLSYGTTVDHPIYATPGVDEFHRLRDDRYYNGSATWFHQFTARFISEFRFTYTRRLFINRVGGVDLGIAEKLGIKGANPRFPPRITVTGYSGFVNNSNQERLQTPIRSDQYAENLTYIRGNHQFKFGYEFRYAANLDINLNTAGGVFGFNDTAAGSSIAALLLGWVNTAVRQEALPIRSRANTMAGFAQDDWKLTPRFTLNLGLRYDIDQPRWEEIDNRQNSFDRYAINPVSGTPGIVTFSGRNGLSKYAHDWDKNNFGPRIGFAWRPADRWVVRGGGALVYTGEYDQATPLVATLGFSLQGDFRSPDNGLTPALLLKDGLPPIHVPAEADLTPGLGAVKVGQNTSTAPEFFERNRRNGYMETFNLNIQRQVTANIVAEIGYLGTLAHKLPAPASITLNQVPPALMGPGNAQIRRPFPQYSDVTVVAPAIGNSNYHGMNLKLQMRETHGLHFQANYTWSRFIDDVAARNELGGSAGNGYSNAYDRHGDRGLSGDHISHRFIGSSVYGLPIGAGRRFHTGSRFLNSMLAGWVTGFIAELRTGPPYGVIEQTNRANAFSASQRPNVVGNPVIEGSRSRAAQVERWFNTAAFAQPAQFTFGDGGRTNGYGPGAISMDLSILKEFAFRERHHVQFRCEMLNFINNPNFALPNLNRGNGAFGRITSLIDGNQARIIQLGLHYKF